MTTRLERPRTSTASAGLAFVAALVVLRLLTGDLPVDAVPGPVRDFFTLAISVVIESLPFVFLGIAVSAVVQIWVPDHVVARVLPGSGLLRRAGASGLGMVVPVCECGNVPMARGLVARGAGVPTAVTFLLAAPLLNPVTIITTYHAFGWGVILAARILGGFLIANFVGWVVSRHPTPQDLLTTSFRAGPSGRGVTEGSRWERSVTLFAEESSAMLPALFVGAGIAAAIQVGIPRSVLLEVGGNPLVSVLALMGLAFVISICSNVDAFFALSLGSTFMPGAIVGFLVFGAMIDLKMLALLKTTFTARAVAQVAALVAAATLVLGLAVNLLA